LARWERRAIIGQRTPVDCARSGRCERWKSSVSRSRCKRKPTSSCLDWRANRGQFASHRKPRCRCVWEYLRHVFSGKSRTARGPFRFIKITANYSVKNRFVTFAGKSQRPWRSIARGNLFRFPAKKTTARFHRITPEGPRPSSGLKEWAVRHGPSPSIAPRIFTWATAAGTIFKISASREIFVFAHDRAVACRVSSRVSSQRRFVRDRADDIQLRSAVYRITQGGESQHVLSRARTVRKGWRLTARTNLYVAAFVRRTPAASFAITPGKAHAGSCSQRLWPGLAWRCKLPAALSLAHDSARLFTPRLGPRPRGLPTFSDN